MTEPNSISYFLSNAQQARILVVGDLMLDRYIKGIADRISPEAPVPVVSVHQRHSQLGGAANVAKNISSLGANVMLGGVIGDDPSTSTFIGLLKQTPIQPDLIIQDDNRRTSTKTRLIAQNQQMIRYDEEDTHPIDLSKEIDFLNKTKRILDRKDLDCIVISDYNKGFMSEHIIKQLIQMGNQYQIPVIADFKPNKLHQYVGVHTVKPNAKEATAMTGINVQDDLNIENALNSLKKSLNCQRVIITRGEKGIYSLDESNQFFNHEAYCRHVYDVTGAGDTVISVVAIGTAIKQPLEKIIPIANKAAAIAVSQVGTVSVSGTDLSQDIF